jgi:tRNA pseudouridine32 synthase / 23S rRNA pseudouridine746 synthase
MPCDPQIVRLPFAIVHVDDSLIVLHKPAGLLAVPGRGADKQDALSTRVQAVHADALIVHRLDQATSGLMLMARGVAMQRAISKAFESRAVHKLYVAVVHGSVADGAGVIDAPLGADWHTRPRQKVDAVQGKASQTRWQVLSRDVAQGTTRVLLEPLTGRTHQLRVHCLHMGHPIVGDTLYGAVNDGYCNSNRAGQVRLLLHAQHLALLHPRTGNAVHWDCPADF